MDRVVIALILTGSCLAQARTPSVTIKQAKDLVRAALPPAALKAPGPYIVHEHDEPSGLYLFSVYGPANAGGSSTIGHFFVDSKTADVWSAVVCEEYKTPALITLQASAKKKLRLTEALYQKLKQHPGPFCEDAQR